MSTVTHDVRADERDAIAHRLAEFFTARQAQAARYGEPCARLWEIAADVAAGGKLVRPSLLLHTYDALAGEGTRPPAASRDTAFDVAVAVEVFHFAFLLHDDVIDQDTVRRGRPNLIGMLLAQGGPESSARVQHWARTGGILMGDLLIAASHQAFARADLARRHRIDLLDVLDRTVADSVAGELTDVGLSHGLVAPQLPTILAMTTQKTASYTFGLPLRAGAILAGAGPRTQEVLGAVGAHLGLGFQLQDDLLSTFGDPARHGKGRFSDLREGKQTAIIACARATPAWDRISPRLGRDDLTEADAVSLANELAACGARSRVEDLVERELEAAVELVDDPAGDLPGSMRAVLHDLVETLRGRSA